MTLSSRVVVIHRNRPLELDVDAVLKHNTKRLVKLLERELNAEKRRLLDELHHKSLVRIFVENRIYKRIEECTTYETVQQEVLDGVNEHRHLLRRDVTGKDVEMLLGVKIKRISRFDIERHQKEIDTILAGLEQVDKNLSDLIAYSIRYLRGIARKYGGAFPRRTEIEAFEEIEVRNLTADELTLFHDEDKGYIGHAIKSETELFACSSLDKVLIVRGDGGYKVMPPPDKLFIEGGLLHCGMPDRESVFLVIYRDDHGHTYIKRFQFGGTIQNKEYRLIPEGSTLIHFSSANPKKLWVRYAKRKGQRIHQQVFDVSKVKVRPVKTQRDPDDLQGNLGGQRVQAEGLEGLGQRSSRGVPGQLGQLPGAGRPVRPSSPATPPANGRLHGFNSESAGDLQPNTPSEVLQ